MLANLAIFIPKWAKGEKLDEGVTMSMMAMVYFIFVSVNSMTYYAMTTLQTFLGVIYRLSTVFELEEFDQTL